MDVRTAVKVGVDKSGFGDEVGGTIVLILQMGTILMEEFF